MRRKKPPKWKLGVFGRECLYAVTKPPKEGGRIKFLSELWKEAGDRKNR